MPGNAHQGPGGRCDGHAIVRDGLRSLLESHDDIRVVAAVGDGRQAANEAIRLAPRVVLMDVAMPVLNGIEATRAMHESSPQTAVLLLSDRDSSPLVQQAVQAGTRGYLTKKECVAAELVKGVRTVARGKRVMRKFDIEDLPALSLCFTELYVRVRAPARSVIAGVSQQWVRWPAGNLLFLLARGCLRKR